MRHFYLSVITFFILSTAGYSQPFSFQNENISIRFTDFKAIGNELHCKFLINSIGTDDILSIQMSKVKLFDAEGNEFISTKGRIGTKNIGPHAMNADLIAGVPVNGEFIFLDAASKRHKMNMFEIPIKLIKQNIFFTVRLTDIVIPFGASASNKELNDNANYKEIDDNVFIELKSATKEDNTLTFNFLVTNFDDDKTQDLISGQCKFFDEYGNEYGINHTFFGNSKGSVNRLVRKECVKGIPIKLSLIFIDDKITDLKEIKLLELNMNNNKFQFRNITP